MAGISYTVTLNDEEARERLQGLMKRIDNPQGFYKQVGEILHNSALDNFRSESGPSGIPWARLMPKTIKQRERKGQTPISILRASGPTGLVGSINIAATRDRVSIGSNKPYAAIHQLGGTIKKPLSSKIIYQHYDEKTDSISARFRKKSKSNFARDVDVKAHTINMPARPYLGVSKDDEAAIIETAVHWLSDM